jgi:hypothetical protein
MKEDFMDEKHVSHGGDGKLRGRDHLGDQGINGSIILKYTL